jgi:hypothetical protein
MVTFSDDELIFVLKALMEHKDKLGRLTAYPQQADDMKPYEVLIRKLIRYRKSRPGDSPRRSGG